MKLTDLTDPIGRAFDDMVEAAEGLFEPTVRLGVTGLSGAGKTVFITSLVHNLMRPARLPLLDPVADERFEAAMLRPQPDPDVPRFDYESHIAALQANAPHWPESTRRISQLRLSVRCQPRTFVRRQLYGSTTLNLDIVDYPGEWLLDLPLLGQRFADWSREVLALCEHEPRRRLSAPWREYAGTLSPDGPADEPTVQRCAALYTDYLRAARTDEARLSRLQPGRFLMPGDLEGSPALTFSPLPPRDGHRHGGRHTLWGLMESRFEAYKDVVVRPFFRDHFARLDRQVVLVDVLRTLNAGPASVADLRAALAGLLECFRPGKASWLWPLLGRRIDRVLFAATKADHVPPGQHDRLAELVAGLLFDPMNRAAFLGADVETMALAAVRATREARVRRDGEALDCIEGVPMDGEAAVIAFPGELPASFAEIDPDAAGAYNFMNFRPPAGVGRDGRGLPHVRLDRALQFLIGDLLE